MLTEEKKKTTKKALKRQFQEWEENRNIFTLSVMVKGR